MYSYFKNMCAKFKFALLRSFSIKNPYYENTKHTNRQQKIQKKCKLPIFMLLYHNLNPTLRYGTFLLKHPVYVYVYRQYILQMLCIQYISKSGKLQDGAQ